MPLASLATQFSVSASRRPKGLTLRRILFLFLSRTSWVLNLRMETSTYLMQAQQGATSPSPSHARVSRLRSHVFSILKRQPFNRQQQRRRDCICAVVPVAADSIRCNEGRLRRWPSAGRLSNDSPSHCPYLVGVPGSLIHGDRTHLMASSSSSDGSGFRAASVPLGSAAGPATVTRCPGLLKDQPPMPGQPPPACSVIGQLSSQRESESAPGSTCERLFRCSRATSAGPTSIQASVFYACR